MTSQNTVLMVIPTGDTAAIDHDDNQRDEQRVLEQVLSAVLTDQNRCHDSIGDALKHVVVLPNSVTSGEGEGGRSSALVMPLPACLS